MLKDTLWMFLITLVPALELRASLPWGTLVRGHPLWLVAAICAVANIALGIAWFTFIGWFERQLERIGFFHRLWMWFCVRARNKIAPKVERWGTLGVALFIGVPLPGSGVYTGGLGAYLLGLPYKKFMIANAIGVLIATAAVSLVVLLGPDTFGWLYDLFITKVEPGV